MKKGIVNILIGCLIGLALGFVIQISHAFMTYRAPDMSAITVDVATVPIDSVNDSFEINNDYIPLTATPNFERKAIDVRDAEYRISEGMLQYFDGIGWVDIANIDELKQK